jgi:hypothetical protein
VEFAPTTLWVFPLYVRLKQPVAPRGHAHAVPASTDSLRPGRVYVFKVADKLESIPKNLACRVVHLWAKSGVRKRWHNQTQPLTQVNTSARVRTKCTIWNRSGALALSGGVCKRKGSATPPIFWHAHRQQFALSCCSGAILSTIRHRRGTHRYRRRFVPQPPLPSGGRERNVTSGENK